MSDLRARHIILFAAVVALVLPIVGIVLRTSQKSNYPMPNSSPTAPITLGCGATDVPEEGFLPLAMPAGATESMTADAAYQLAMDTFVAEDYLRAAGQFDQFCLRWEDSERFADAVFMKAESLHKAGESRKAKKTYREFLDYFPGSKHRTTCLQRLGIPATHSPFRQQ